MLYLIMLYNTEVANINNLQCCFPKRSSKFPFFVNAVSHPEPRYRKNDHEDRRSPTSQ